MPKAAVDVAAQGHLSDHLPPGVHFVVERSAAGPVIAAAHGRQDSGCDLIAEVGLELTWSGYTGTVAAVAVDHAMLSLENGCSLRVPFGDTVYAGNQTRGFRGPGADR